jgi:hypothetical protein
LKDQFKQLIECLLTQPLSGSMEDDIVLLRQAAERFNVALPQSTFNTEAEGRIMGPCPFACSGSIFKLALIGLNPLDGGVQANTDTQWDKWADFHTSNNFEQHHVFKNISYDLKHYSYYGKVVLLYQSLLKRRLVKWSEFSGGLSGKELQNKFLTTIKDNPICAAEFIPFPSENMQSLDSKGIEKLFSTVVGFDKYLTGIVALINSKLSYDGCIVCNGKAASEALVLILAKYSDQYGPLKIILDKRRERGYLLAYWGERRVLLLHCQFRNRGKLNGYIHINDMLKDTFDVFNIKNDMQFTQKNEDEKVVGRVANTLTIKMTGRKKVRDMIFEHVEDTRFGPAIKEFVRQTDSVHVKLFKYQYWFLPKEFNGICPKLRIGTWRSPYVVGAFFEMNTQDNKIIIRYEIGGRFEKEEQRIALMKHLRDRGYEVQQRALCQNQGNSRIGLSRTASFENWEDNHQLAQMLFKLYENTQTMRKKLLDDVREFLGWNCEFM